MNRRPTGYESVALPLSYTGYYENLTFKNQSFIALGNFQDSQTKIDPDLRKRLLKESKAPWLGLRRGIWFALFGSAGLGFLVMALRFSQGAVVPLNDVAIQLGALVLFGWLLWIDRRRED